MNYNQTRQLAANESAARWNELAARDVEAPQLYLAAAAVAPLMDFARHCAAYAKLRLADTWRSSHRGVGGAAEPPRREKRVS